MIDQGELDEEKEDITKDEEQAIIQTLIPKIGTPTQTLQKSSTDMISL